ncbi:MAG: hypothetical protein RMK98_08095 [Bacteroidia bacterium]|nr:hypothetical protein [Bacteroidia bacterium]
MARVDNFTSLSAIGFGLILWIAAYKSEQKIKQVLLYLSGSIIMILAVLFVHMQALLLLPYPVLLINLLVFMEQKKLNKGVLFLSLLTLLLAMTKYSLLSPYEKEVST